MFDFGKLKPAARRAAFAHMSAAGKAGKAAHKMAASRSDGHLRVSRDYMRTGKPSNADVSTLVEAYRRMHGKAPGAAQLARLKAKSTKK